MHLCVAFCVSCMACWGLLLLVHVRVGMRMVRRGVRVVLCLCVCVLLPFIGRRFPLLGPPPAAAAAHPG